MFYTVLEGSRGFQGDFKKSLEVLWREGRGGRRARRVARRVARRGI